MMEEVEELTKHLDDFKMKENGQHSKEKEGNLCFVDVTVSGVKVATLVDTDAIHSFISEHTATLLHYKPKRSMSTFKFVVNSTVNSMT